MGKTLPWLVAIGGVLASGIQAQDVCQVDWSLHETLRIGSLDGADALTSVTNVAWGTEGELYVPQVSIGSVFVFSSDGAFLRSFGREGSGPGDFENGPHTVTWVGGKLWVADRWRTQSFELDGTPDDFVSFQTLVPGEGSIYRPEAPLSDGSMWATRYSTTVPRSTGRDSLIALRRFSSEGEILDTIALLDVRNSRVVVNDQTGAFGTHPIWGTLPGNGLGYLRQTLTPDRTSVVLVGEVREKPRTGSFDLLRIHISGDTLQKSSIPYEPVRIDRAEVDWWYREIGALAAQDSLQGLPGIRRMTDARRNRDRKRAQEAFSLPEFYPPVRQILAGADDTIWILREFRVLEGVDIWEVYDSHGQLIGRITDIGRARFVPWVPRLRVLRASRDEIWTTTIDEWDVPYIHRYRVDRGCK